MLQDRMLDVEDGSMSRVDFDIKVPQVGGNQDLFVSSEIISEEDKKIGMVLDGTKVNGYNIALISTLREAFQRIGRLENCFLQQVFDDMIYLPMDLVLCLKDFL